MGKKILIIVLILAILGIAGFVGYNFFREHYQITPLPTPTSNVPQLVPEGIYIPTPTPTAETQTVYIYQQYPNMWTPQPTVDPYWVPGPWGEYNFG